MVYSNAMRKNLAVGIIVLLVCLAVSVAQETPVHWTAKPPADPIPAGASFEVKLDARIDGAWHMYSATQPPGGPITTRFKVLTGAPFEIAGQSEAIRTDQGL